MLMRIHARAEIDFVPEYETGGDARTSACARVEPSLVWLKALEKALGRLWEERDVSGVHEPLSAQLAQKDVDP